MGELMLPLVQQIALDLACSCLYSSGSSTEPVLILPSSPAIAAGVSQRLGDAKLASESGKEPDGRLRLYHRALWAIPRSSTWRDNFRMIDGVLSADGVLSIVLSGTGGWLGPYSGGMLQSWSIARGLRAAFETLGYRRERAFTLGGVEAVRWAVSARLARLRGRPELVDRAESGYRAALTTPDQLLPFLLVWQVRKGQRVR